MNNKIEAIIFDLGRVLVQVDITRGILGLFDHSFENGTETAVACMMREPSYAAYNAGKLSPQEFYEQMKNKLSFKMEFNEFAKKWCDVFDPMEGMDTLVNDLHRKVKIGLLSDTDPMHWDYLKNTFTFIDAIEKPTLSFETGFRKPSKQAYLAAVKNVGADASHCLYVDDLMENVIGAKNAGLDAVQFLGARKLRQDLAEKGITQLERI
jgi:HAD superfamily hydrolase (TIGR01509 family)